MKLGGREGKSLEKKYAWRTVTSWLIFSLYGSYAVSAVVCGLWMGLWAAAANHFGKNGLCQALHSRGEMAVGQERMRSLLKIESQRMSSHSMGIAWVRKKPCCPESEDHS